MAVAGPFHRMRARERDRAHVSDGTNHADADDDHDFPTGNHVECCEITRVSILGPTAPIWWADVMGECHVAVMGVTHA